MAIGLPIVGALIGGFGGAAFGTWTAIGIGASVGWLVGSWGMYSMMDMKNDPIDTGANEAPRFNSAVRGAIVPVLFGTNRVPAQIIFQQNFEAIRIDSGGGTSGGGLFGGSGMGGKSPSAPASVSYQYKIDAVYHLGMPVTSIALLGGWVGSQKITDDSISSIALGGSSGYQSIAEETEDTNDAGISYDEAIYFDGNIDEENTWSYLTSEVGAPIVWPGTTWVGFRGLVMGAQANMPQLSFEVGPSDGSMSLNTYPIWRHEEGVDSVGDTPRPTGIDQYGNIYFGNKETSSERCKCVALDGTILWEVTNSQIHANFDDTALDFDGSIFVTIADTFCQPIMDGTKLCWVISCIRDPPGPGSTRVYVVGISDAPDPAEWAAGTLPAINGWVWFRLGLAQHVPTKILEFKDILGATSMLVISTHDESQFFLCTPPPALIESGVKTQNSSGGGFTDANQITALIVASADNVSAYGVFGNGAAGQNYPWWVVTSADAADLTTTNTINMWLSRRAMADVTNDEWCDYIGRYKVAYPDGAMIRFAFPIQTYETVNFAGQDQHTINVAAATESVINTKFIDSEGAVVIPSFFDETLNALGETANTSSPIVLDSVFVKTVGFGTQLVIFPKIDEDNYSLSPEALPAGIRVFLYRSNVVINGTSYSDVFVTLGEANGFLAQEGDLSQNWDDTTGCLTHHTAHAFYLNGTVYIAGVQDLDGGFYLSKIANIDLGATDVTPPYIIRQILVHEVFGVDPGADIIDESSYLAAVSFCELNNVKVSTQYRREGPALQFIELLLALYGGWLTVLPAEGRIKFGVMDLANTPVRTIDNDHLVIMKEGDLPVEVTKGSSQDTANIIRVNYIDRTINYQNNQVEDRDEVDEDITGPRTREFPADFVMSRETAQWLATRTLWNGLYTRDAYKFYLGWKDSDLEPGDVITLVDSFDNIHEVAQIVFWKEVQRGTYEVRAAQQLPYVAGRIASQVSSSLWQTINGGGTDVGSLGYWTGSGTVSTSGITTNPSSPYEYGPSGPLPAPVYTAAYELPQEYQASASEVYVGWRARDFAAGARLYTSVDGVTYAPIADVSPYPISGTFITDIPLDNRVFVEGVEVLLHPASGWTSNSPAYTHNLTLNDVNEAAMHAGAGLIWCGSEMLAYQNITLVGQNRYRFKRLYRGWGGTAKHAHTSGDNWHKHGTGIFALEYTSDQIGTTIYYKVTPYNSGGIAYHVSSVTAQTYQVKGAYYKPQNPSAIQYLGNRGLTKIQVGSEVDVPLEWQDGARKSGFGSGGFGTAPGNYGGFATDTMSHFWEVVVVGSGNTVVRSTTTGSPGYTYTNSMNFADNGAWRGNVAMSVTAVSPYGRSPRTSVISMELFI